MYSRWREGLQLRLAADPRTIYIFHSPEETVFKRWSPLQALVAERSKGIRVEKVIADRSGKQIFAVMKVEDRGG